jgi:hypothetical protein
MPEAMVEAFQRHRTHMIGLVHRLFATVDPEDIIQDVFEELFRKPQGFDARRGSLATGSRSRRKHSWDHKKCTAKPITPNRMARAISTTCSASRLDSRRPRDPRSAPPGGSVTSACGSGTFFLTESRRGLGADLGPVSLVGHLPRAARLCRPRVATTAAEAKDPTNKEDQSNDPQDWVHEPEASKDQCQKQDNQNQSHIIPL